MSKRGGSPEQAGDARLAALLAGNLLVLTTSGYALRVGQTASRLMAWRQSDPSMTAVELAIFLAPVVAYVLLAPRLTRIALAVTFAGACLVALAAAAASSGLDLKVPAALACSAAVSCLSVAMCHAVGFAADLCTVPRGMRLFGFVAAGAVAGALIASVAVEPLFEALGLVGVLAAVAPVLGCNIVLSLLLQRSGRTVAGAGGSVDAARPPGRLRDALRGRYVPMLAVFALLVAMTSELARLGFPAHHDHASRAAEALEKSHTEATMVVSAVVLVLLYPRALNRAGVLAALLVAPLMTVAALGLAAARLTPAFLSTADAVHVAESLHLANWMVLLLAAPRSAKYFGALLIPPVAERLAALVVGVGSLVSSPGSFALPGVVIVALATTAAAIVVARQFRLRAESPLG